MTANLFDIADKAVVVTGGLGQLGAQFSKALIEAGARVAVFDIQTAPQRVSERFGDLAANPNLRIYTVDITSRKSIEDAVRQVLAEWGTPHGLVNNAALDSPPHAPAAENGPFETYPEASWDKVMEVNVKGTFLCCQAIGGRMAEAGRGSIINIASIYGMISPDQRIYEYRHTDEGAFFKPVAYSASKSAIFNLTRYLATYWSSRNVRVNTLTFAGVFNKQDE
ncbi:MAG: SDR family NAD(P)-dependent oxidoreductase, partial [Chloroflexota bacterium]